QPVRPVRPRCTLRPKSGVSGHILGVSGPPSPENPEPYPKYLNPHEPGVSGQMARLSGPLPVRPVHPTGQTGPTQTKPRINNAAKIIPKSQKLLGASLRGFMWMLLTRGNHLKPSKTSDRSISSQIPLEKLSPVESLNHSTQGKESMR